MEFNSNKPIYLQIVDSIYEKIISSEMKGEDRIPSVRELGADIGVNPNTVMRSFEKMTADGVIYNKRGIGYFIAPDAQARVLESQRDTFLRQEWPAVLRKCELLGIDPKTLL